MRTDEYMADYRNYFDECMYHSYVACTSVLIFKGNKTLPKPVQILGRYLPPAIMAVLIVYCLKDAREDFLGTGVWQLLAVGVVAVSYKWKHNTFLSILLGTVCYMVLLRIF